MARLSVGSIHFDADLVVFDKDGTLSDFEWMWGQVARGWLHSLTEGCGGREALQEIAALMGFDLEQDRVLPESPLVIASEETLQAIAAAVLYRRGVSWQGALERAESTMVETIAGIPLEQLVRPTGDVVGVLNRLRSAGAQVGVVTIDSRQRTEQVLRILGVADLVNDLVCGDDGPEWKPAPDMFVAVCDHLQVRPERSAVVGDTVADMQMARRGGAGLKVGVLSGGGEPDLLRQHADVVLRSIDEIGIAA